MWAKKALGKIKGVDAWGMATKRGKVLIDETRSKKFIV